MKPQAADFDPAALECFARSRLADTRGRYSLERIAGGQSNPTYFVTLGARRMVLRKKPAGEVLPSAHAVDREYRVLSALSETGVPVQKTILYCDDLSVVGTPFYLMERLEGRVFHDASLPGTAPADREAMIFEMAETLARLHDVNPASVGLGDFGCPSSYFQRQIRRWTQQYELARWRVLPDVETLIEWLPKHLPADDAARVCHGDFRIGNLIFHPAEPRVVGVLARRSLGRSRFQHGAVDHQPGGIRGLPRPRPGTSWHSPMRRLRRALFRQPANA